MSNETAEITETKEKQARPMHAVEAAKSYARIAAERFHKGEGISPRRPHAETITQTCEIMLLKGKDGEHHAKSRVVADLSTTTDSFPTSAPIPMAVFFDPEIPEEIEGDGLWKFEMGSNDETNRLVIKSKIHIGDDSHPLLESEESASNFMDSHLHGAKDFAKSKGIDILSKLDS